MTDLPIIEARQFVLKDAQGRTRASLGFNEQQLPTLYFTDSQGQRRMEVGLEAEDGTAAVTMFTESGEPTVRLIGSEDGTAVLQLGEQGLTLYADEAGNRSVTMRDAVGDIRLEVEFSAGFDFARVWLPSPAGGFAELAVSDRFGAKLRLESREHFTEIREGSFELFGPNWCGLIPPGADDRD